MDKKFSKEGRKTFGDLKIGDEVVFVYYYLSGVHQRVNKLVSKENNGITFVFQDIEHELNSYSNISNYLRKIDVHDASKVCIRRSKYYNEKIFSDFEVAKHSVSCHLRERERKVKGKIRRLQTSLGLIKNCGKPWNL